MTRRSSRFPFDASLPPFPLLHPDLVFLSSPHSHLNLPSPSNLDLCTIPRFPSIVISLPRSLPLSLSLSIASNLAKIYLLLSLRFPYPCFSNLVIRIAIEYPSPPPKRHHRYESNQNEKEETTIDRGGGREGRFWKGREREKVQGNPYL